MAGADSVHAVHMGWLSERLVVAAAPSLVVGNTPQRLHLWPPPPVLLPTFAATTVSLCRRQQLQLQHPQQQLQDPGVPWAAEVEVVSCYFLCQGVLGSFGSTLEPRQRQGKSLVHDAQSCDSCTS